MKKSWDESCMFCFWVACYFNDLVWDFHFTPSFLPPSSHTYIKHAIKVNDEDYSDTQENSVQFPSSIYPIINHDINFEWWLIPWIHKQTTHKFPSQSKSIVSLVRRYQWRLLSKFTYSLRTICLYSLVIHQWLVLDVTCSTRSIPIFQTGVVYFLSSHNVCVHV